MRVEQAVVWPCACVRCRYIWIVRQHARSVCGVLQLLEGEGVVPVDPEERLHSDTTQRTEGHRSSTASIVSAFAIVVYAICSRFVPFVVHLFVGFKVGFRGFEAV